MVTSVTQFDDQAPIRTKDLILKAGMAFGNGALGMNITPAASRLIFAIFEKRFAEHIKHYREHHLAILAYATGLGWYAATLSRARNRAIIGPEEIKIAIDKFPCPIIPPVFGLLKELGEGFRG